MVNRYLTKLASIEINPANKGLLHKKLGVPKSQKISGSKLKSAEKGASGKLKKEIVFAENAKKWKKK